MSHRVGEVAERIRRTLSMPSRSSGVMLCSVVCCATAAGCTSMVLSRLPEASAGSVGCAQEEIEIINPKLSARHSSWTAACRGVRYHCQEHQLATDVHQTTCAPEPPVQGSETTPPASAALGCQYDTQCKGERICEQGRCVDVASGRSDKPADSLPASSAP